jgi:hypothetical protein
MTSCSSLASQLWALPALGALRFPLSGPLSVGVRLVVCSLMPFSGAVLVLPPGGYDG